MDFFKKKTGKTANPLDVVTTSSSIATEKQGGGVVKNIMENNLSNTSKLLDVTPDINQALLENLAPPKSVLLTVLKAVLIVSVIMSVVSYVFFTSQSTTKLQFVNNILGIKSINTKLEDMNKDIIDKQTEVNYFRYLQVKGHLDGFIEHGAKFSQAYQTFTADTTSEQEKESAKKVLDAERKTLQTLLRKIQEKVGGSLAVGLAPIYIEDEGVVTPSSSVFRQSLVQKYNQQYKKWSTSDKISDKRVMRNFDQVKKIVSNSKFKSTILNVDIADMQDDEVYEFLSNLNDIIVSDLSTIQEIKENRIIWSDVMAEIEKRTNMADVSFSHTPGSTEGVTYTNYDFNSKTRKITITGTIKTNTSDTFTKHIDLMNKLNSSDMFSDANIDSFTKTISDGDGYSSSIRFNLTLN